MTHLLTIDDELNLTIDADGVHAAVQLAPQDAIAAADLLRRYALLVEFGKELAALPSIKKPPRKPKDRINGLSD